MIGYMNGYWDYLVTIHKEEETFNNPFEDSEFRSSPTFHYQLNNVELMD